MKSLKFLLLIISLVSLSASAQNLQLRTTSGKIVTYFGREKSVTTTDATATTIDSLPITTNTAGLIDVTVVGYTAAGAAVTGRILYRYKKPSGTLTLATGEVLSAIVTDTGLASSGTFTVTAVANNIVVQVTGKASTSVKWRSLITQFAP